MKLSKFLSANLVAASFFLLSCGGTKDSDIKASVEDKLKGQTEMSVPANVSVKDGVVTLTGQCTDENCKAECESLARSAKGVKSVVNNMTVAAAMVPTTPVEVATDSALTKGVTDATKDHPTVKASVSADGVITLTGEIKRDDLATLIQSLNTLKPKSINNQLTIK